MVTKNEHVAILVRSLHLTNLAHEELIHQSNLGTAEFAEWVSKTLPRKTQRKVPSLTKLQQHISVERVIGEVAKAGKAQTEDLGDRKTKL